MPQQKFLDRQEAPDGQPWREYLKGESPQVVSNMLAGRWGECLVAAVVAEHTGGPGCAAGDVIDHLCRLGHKRCERAADRLEEAAHTAMRNRTPLPTVGTPLPSVGQSAARSAPPDAPAREESSGSDSHGSDDDEILKLCSTAPLHAHIGSALEKHVGKCLPKEIVEFFTSRGTGIASSKLLKISFHATWLVNLEHPLSHDDQNFTRAIVQIIGAELCDKPIYGHQPITAETLARAGALAKDAGVKVAAVLGTGECNIEDKEIGALGFIVQEFVVTDTVEDEVSAPQKEFGRIHEDIRQRLGSLPLVDMDTEPIVRFESLSAWLEWLKTQVPGKDEALLEALSVYAESIALAPPSHGPLALLHQDDHCHNILCSKSKSGSEWVLDAVIDWESAAIADPQFKSKEEPWMTARCFSVVVRGANLASRFVQGTLPRCELEELIEGYDRAAQELSKKDWLPYETWSARVARHRS